MLNLKPLIYTFGVLTALSNRSVYAQQYIRFGNGGGGTNLKSYFDLYNDGQLYSIKQIGNQIDTVYKKSIPKTSAKKILKKARKLKLEALKYNYPNKIYTFIAYGTNTITWGDKNAPVLPKQVTEYYILLKQTTKKAK